MRFSTSTFGIFALILSCLAQLVIQAQPQHVVQNSAQQPENNEAKMRKLAELFEGGQTAHQRGDLEKAVELYTEALKIDPTVWQVELQLSVANVSLKHYSQAYNIIISAITKLRDLADKAEIKPYLVRAQIILGQICLAQGKYAESKSAFQQALQLNPNANQSFAGLAELALAQQNYAEAVANAKSAINNGDSSTSIELLLAEAFIRQQLKADALLVLNQILSHDPQLLPALRQRAELLLSQGDLMQAIKDYQQVVQLTKALADKLALANAYLLAKLPQDALGIYQQITKDDPLNLEARRGIAALLVEMGKDQEAITQLETVIQSEPQNALIHAQLAELYLSANHEKALAHYRDAAKLVPDNDAYKIGIATALVKLRRFQDAIPTLRDVISRNQKTELIYFAHTNLATALFELDDFANAAREFVWILENVKEQKRAAITLYFLGICFDKLGDYLQALKAYEQFLKLADSQNQLEIDKVKLRLPSLQRQIKEGKGQVKKP